MHLGAFSDIDYENRTEFPIPVQSLSSVATTTLTTTNEVNELELDTTYYVGNCSDDTKETREHVDMEAFFYIVVVITFYATSIILLLIKYAGNDHEETNLKYQYSEFVKRDKFQTPRYKNMLALQKTKTVLQNLQRSVLDVSTCPVIIVSDFDQQARNTTTLNGKSMSIGDCDSEVEYSSCRTSMSLKSICNSAVYVDLSEYNYFHALDIGMARSQPCDSDLLTCFYIGNGRQRSSSF